MNVGKRLETGRQLFLKRYRSDRRIQALTWVIIVVVILGIGVHLYHRTPKRQPVRHNPWYFLVGTPANELRPPLKSTIVALVSWFLIRTENSHRRLQITRVIRIRAPGKWMVRRYN